MGHNLVVYHIQYTAYLNRELPPYERGYSRANLGGRGGRA